MSERYNKKLNRFDSQPGAVVIIVCAILAALLSLSAYLYYSNSSDVLKAQLQAAADAAVIAGAEGLCGTQACFDNSIQVVNKVLDQHTALGGSGSSSLSFDGDCVGSGVPNEVLCELKNLKIKFERGFWYPDPEEGKFQFWSFEADSTFQPPGLPRATVANAFRLEITRLNFGSLLTFPWLGSPSGGDVTVQAVATAGEIKSNCIAPFAIPICALHNDDGLFQDSNMCAGDRIFTRADRYCGAGNGDCGLYPSFEYGPCSKTVASKDRHFKYLGTPFNITAPAEVNLQFGPAMFYDRSGPIPSGLPLSAAPEEIGCFSPMKANVQAIDMEGLLSASEPVEKDYDLNPDDWAAYNRMDRRLNYSPPFFANGLGNYSDDPSETGVYDNFGVVGMPSPGSRPETANAADVLEIIDGATEGQWITGGASRCAVDAKVGDKFYVIADGLDNSVPGAEDIVWDEIVNKKSGYTANPSSGFPASLKTDIGTIEANRFRALVAGNSPMRGDGLCRSRRTQMNVMFSPTSTAFGTSRFWHLRSVPPATFNPASSENVPFGTTVAAALARRLGASIIPYPGYVDPYGAPRTPNPPESAENISGQRYAFEIGPSQTALGGAKVTDSTPVWQVLVPVIADLSSGAASCAGINGAARDPVFNDEAKAYEIVKFVRVNIFDVDLSGVPTPALVAPLSEQYFGAWASDPTAGNDFRTALVPPLTPINPGDPGPDGWFFNNGIERLGCNLVRARISCDAVLTTRGDEIRTRIATLVAAPDATPTPAP